MAGPPPPPPLPTTIPTPGPVTVENGQHQDEENPQSSGFIVFMNITNTITHLCLGAVSFTAIFFANNFNSNSSLSQHIYLCVTGYMIMMSQAVLSLSPHSGWVRCFKFQTKKTIHWIMQIVGSILAITGSIIRIVDVENSFQSTHGTLGIVALIFTILSLAGGVFNLFASNLMNNPTIVRTLHSCLGSLTLIVAFLALIFAFNGDFFRFFGGDTNADLSISLSVVALVGTILSPWVTVFKRIFNKM